MITIDRDSNKPLHEQLVEQLRYLIASGQYKVDETLPSTRTLAEQVGVSFHTVRKAYQQLEQEGRLEARVGSGFRVIDRTPLGKSERIERGASIVQETLQQLIGLGLQEEEVEYLFQEQFDLLSGTRLGHKMIFVAPARELASLCAGQITHSLQQHVEAVTAADLGLHQDADFAFAPFPDVRAVMEAVPRTDVFGVLTYLTPEALEAVARLLPHETLGLVTHYADAIQPLMAAIRAQTGLIGQILASSIDQGSRQIEQIARQTDLLLYTPPCRRRLLSILDDALQRLAVAPVVSRESIVYLRQAVPV